MSSRDSGQDFDNTPMGGTASTEQEPANLLDAQGWNQSLSGYTATGVVASVEQDRWGHQTESTMYSELNGFRFPQESPERQTMLLVQTQEEEVLPVDDGDGSAIDHMKKMVKTGSYIANRRLRKLCEQLFAITGLNIDVPGPIVRRSVVEKSRKSMSGRSLSYAEAGSGGLRKCHQSLDSSYSVVSGPHLRLPTGVGDHKQRFQVKQVDGNPCPWFRFTRTFNSGLRWVVGYSLGDQSNSQPLIAELLRDPGLSTEDIFCDAMTAFMVFAGHSKAVHGVYPNTYLKIPEEVGDAFLNCSNLTTTLVAKTRQGDRCVTS